MLMIRFVGMLLVGLIVLSAGIVFGQTYPSRPVRVVTGNAGGGLDYLVRLFTPGLQAALGQPVVVDNRGAFTPIEVVSKASPDGYTVLVASSGFWTTPLMQETPYALKDFTPVTAATRQSNILVVHPSVAANSVKELVALA